MLPIVPQRGHRAPTAASGPLAAIADDIWRSGDRGCQGDRADERVSPGPVSLAGWMEAVLGEEAAADHLGVLWHVPACGYPAQRVVHCKGYRSEEHKSE